MSIIPLIELILESEQRGYDDERAVPTKPASDSVGVSKTKTIVSIVYVLANSETRWLMTW